MWPDHLIKLDEWIALTEDNSRHIEVIEGVLVIAPKPPLLHQRAAMRLASAIEGQLPTGLSAAHQVEVVLIESLLTVRVPDAIVVDSEFAETNPDRCPAEKIKLAVEILSVATKSTDRVMKLAEYAEAGIGHYWIVDLDQPHTLAAFQLVADTYKLVGRFTGTVTLDLNGTPITLDLDKLTTKRP
jgi:Uma2 family endonuclease